MLDGGGRGRGWSGELSLMLGVEGMAQARPERILHAPSRVTLSDCLEVCITEHQGTNYRVCTSVRLEQGRTVLGAAWCPPWAGMPSSWWWRRSPSGCHLSKVR